MITNREMFCTISGTIVTLVPDPRLKTELLIQSAKEFGIEKDEAEKIIKDTQKALGFVINKMKNEMAGKKPEEFGI